MTDPRITVTEDELHAYIDNELPAERRGDVEAWLATHPDDAERVESWRAMAAALHARYDSVADEAVPRRLEVAALRRRPRRSRISRWMRSTRIGFTSSRFATPSKCPAASVRICSNG